MPSSSFLRDNEQFPSDNCWKELSAIICIHVKGQYRFPALFHLGGSLHEDAGHNIFIEHRLAVDRAVGDFYSAALSGDPARLEAVS